jgi:sugar phosphate isomerase/epimerase
MGQRSTAVSRRRLMAMGAAVVGSTALTVAGGGSPAAAQADEDGTYRMPVDVGALLPRERIGIQLYTVRNRVQEVGFAEVFRRLAAMGFSEVEFAGYGDGRVSGLPELRALLDANGLTPTGSHVGGISAANAAQHIDAALQLGLPAIGEPSLPTFSSGSQAKARCEDWNAVGQMCRDAGLRFYLHNHAAEFGTFVDESDGQTKRHYDAMLQYTDPELVFFELDIYWAFVGRAAQADAFEPVDYVTADPDRFILFHVKDGEAPAAGSNPLGGLPFVGGFAPGGYTMTDVGQGDIDFEAFFNAIRAVDLAAGGDGTGRHRGYCLEHDNPGNGKGEWRTAATGYGWMAHGIRTAG